MDRRRFLGTGAAAAAAITGSACAPALRLSEQRPNDMPADMHAYLAKVDAGMERLSRWSSAVVAPNWKGDRAEVDAIGRTALQSMFFTGMVGDLPLEGQLHPGVQARIGANMALMDEATDRMTAFLRRQTPDDLAAVRLGLRDYDAGAQIFAAFDAEAGALGVSPSRRAQTRTIYSNAEWRLRNQPPSLLVSEYLEKVERLSASDVPLEARRQALAARLADDAFWATSAAPSDRNSRITRGAKVMGFGVLVFAAGGAFVAAGAFPGVFAMTVGVVIVLVGLVILLVGLATPGPETGASKTPN